MQRRELLAGAMAGLVACGLEAPTRAPATRAAARTSALSAAMQSFVDRGDVPGIVTGIRRGGAVDVQAFGVRTLGHPELARRDTIFRISSMTKPVTAVATLMLVEEGKLQLDEPVDRLLPELAHRRVLRSPDAPLDDTVPATRAITVRDLLAFTMGLGISLDPPGTHPIQREIEALQLGQGIPAYGSLPEADEWMRRLGSLPLVHQPGAAWMYNTGSDVLGVLVARASGMGFESFLRERVFAPLGMQDTGFSVPDASLHRLATSYVVDPKTGALVVYDTPRNGQWSSPPPFASGAGGLVSTIDDYLAFAEMLLERGSFRGRRLLSPESVRQMTTDQLTAQQKAATRWTPGYFDAHGWGFGVAVVTARDELGLSPGAFGWFGGMGSSWFCDPSERRVGILLTQRAWTSPVPPPIDQSFWRIVNDDQH